MTPGGAVSRRQFLGGAAALTVGAPAGCGRSTHRAVAASEPAYWTPDALGPRRHLRTDVCVYGATTAGVAAAVAAARLGLRCVLVAVGRHVGGMTASGLSVADVGSTATIGGIAAEVYLRIGRAYGVPHAVYRYQPHVASAVLTGMVRHAGVTVLPAQPVRSLRRRGGAIESLETVAGSTVSARQYIDASYEGDLLARSGAAYVTGREANTTWGETLNGYRPATPGSGFGRPVDAYRLQGVASSGLVDGVSVPPERRPGSRDAAAMAYGFRLCLSEAPGRIPFTRPAGYRPADWDLAARAIAAGQWDLLDFRVGLPGGDYDLNASGGVSTDAIGIGEGWADADYDTRQGIFDRHLAYTRGLLWFAGHDPRVPADIRREVRRFGLAPGEFTGTGGWPPELYVREARRLVNPATVTEADCTGARRTDQPVALASYKVDSHPCRRIAVGGAATNEGTISAAVARPWGIPLGALLPERRQVANLTVAVCIASTHVAWSSLRMEPVFMMLGQAAGVIAGRAARTRSDVHDLPYPAVAAALRAGGARLALPASAET